MKTCKSCELYSKAGQLLVQSIVECVKDKKMIAKIYVRHMELCRIFDAKKDKNDMDKGI